MTRPGPTRRAFLAGSVATTVGLVTGRGAAAGLARPVTTSTPSIIRRSDWGGDLPPRGPLAEEAAGDVRFLLVHHTQTPNGEGPDQVAGRLRSIYGYHTGSKGWPDVAYNYFVDAHGRVWEGRTGSLDGPVRGDATGGSQGFAQLCCFVGDHSVEPPTPAAVDAMVGILAHLADRYGIDLGAGPTITFTSRGSNRWPAGTTVTTEPVAGHRDMSMSACPGDAAYALIRPTLLAGAQRILGVTGTTTTAVAATAPAPAPAGLATTAAPAAAPSSAASAGGPRHGTTPGFTIGGATAAVAAASAWALRRRSDAEPA